MLKENIEQDYYIDNRAAQNLSTDRKELWNAIFECRDDIKNILLQCDFGAENGYGKLDELIAIASYLLAKACETEEPDKSTFDDICKMGLDEDVIDTARGGCIDDAWGALLFLTRKYQYKVFCLTVLLRNLSDPNSTPEGITDLACNLLDIHEKDRVADLCCGTGSVITAFKKAYPDITAVGYDKDLEAIAYAKVYDKVDDTGIEYVWSDIFSLTGTDGSIGSYDKIFANYPFGMRLRQLDAGKYYLESLTQKIPAISKATSSDWIYNMLMIQLLAEGGKAVGIMTNGSTWNMIDTPIRQYFVENGLIECVIALPGRLFGSTTIPTSMIVMSHGNKGVRLVDASSQFTAGRRINELSEDDVDAILAMIETDSDNSFFVDTEKLRENDYVLNTNRYILDSESIEDGVAFGSVIKRITRGAAINAKELDKLASPVPTSTQYLMTSNIQNGMIDQDLPYLTKIDERNERYCLTNHCIILSKIGFPYKIVVAEIGNGQKILANGNLFIIELDEEKADPYYVAAFFSGEQGTAALKSITAGATIPSLSVDQIKKLIIPLPSIEKQREISARYQQARDEITMLQVKLEKARNRMMHIFEEEG